MERHEALRPFSRGHQQVLIHARDLRWRATYVERGDSDLAPHAVSDFLAFAPEHLERHLTAEERVLFPRLESRDDAELSAALERAKTAHTDIRAALTTLAGVDDPATNVPAIRRMATLLDDHIRDEERALFPAAERVLGADELAAIDAAIDDYAI